MSTHLSFSLDRKVLTTILLEDPHAFLHTLRANLAKYLAYST